jgi:hypothetical protein
MLENIFSIFFDTGPYLEVVDEIKPKQTQTQTQIQSQTQIQRHTSGSLMR